MKFKYLFYLLPLLVAIVLVQSCGGTSRRTPLPPAGDLALGKQLYYKGRGTITACASCHGAHGRGLSGSGRTLRYDFYALRTYKSIIRRLSITSWPRRSGASIEKYKEMIRIAKALSAHDKQSLARFVAYELLRLNPGDPDASGSSRSKSRRKRWRDIFD